MHAFSVAEVLENDMPHEAQARLDELRSIVQTLAQTDESVVRAMRDRYVREVIAWLPRPSSQNRLQRVGNIAAQFTRLFAVEEGRIVAPTSVVRAFIAARWNSIHGIDFTEGMSDDGKRAYFGWIALHAESMSSGERIDALTRYGSLAGPRALEAAAALYFEANRLDLALPAMEAAFQASGNTRLRNHALALAEIAAAPDRHAPGELPVHGP